jgi:metal-responsive CopG/Arc/MetJ family transcriptional regulator
MKTAKIAITIQQDLLTRLDQLVKERRFPSRSRAVQEALQEKLARLDRGRLARECARLDRRFEQALAEEGLAEEVEAWPEY